MPAPKDTLKDRLARYRQIQISVIGRKSGLTILIPMRRLSNADCRSRRKEVVTSVRNTPRH
jgi:hypothetical protein